MKVYIAAGSNKGDGKSNVLKALLLMQERIRITRISRFVKNPPAEGAEGGDFLNGVLEGYTELSPDELFEFLQKVEKKLGRTLPHRKGEEREIDLDIVFYGNRVLKSEKLVIPHPRYRDRAFVAGPLCEIAPGFVDPETKTAVAAVYKELAGK